MGDKDFRKKSRARVEQIIDGGKHFFMVNHSLNELVRLWFSRIWLKEGRLIMDGAINDVISAYQEA